MRFSSAGAALLLAVASAPAPAQQVVPGARAEVVQLDAVVTDAKGTLVRDLMQADFQIFEDGKPQAVSQFFVVTRSRPAVVATPAPSDPGVVGPASSAATPAAAETAAPGRQVVILVDDLHISLHSMVEAKRSLRRFVDEVASPDDSIAVVTTSGAGPIQQLTRDRAVVGQALERLVTREPSSATNRSARLTPEQAALVLKGDRAALQLGIETVMTEPGTLLDANSPQAAVEAGPAGQSAAGAAAGATGVTRDAVEKVAQREVERQAVQLLNEALRYSNVTLNTLEDVVRSFARMPGRKLCLVVSDGFLDGAGSRESRAIDLRRVLDAATRSGTVVYALDSRGLLTGSDASAATVGASPGVQARVDRAADQIKRDTLITLADGTGGFLVRGTNDPLGGLRRMLDDNEAYYLMAYEPTNIKRDGRFRKIEVRIASRPELKVRTRTGYYAPDASKPAPPTRVAAPALTAPSLSVSPAEARTLLSAPIDAGAFPSCCAPTTWTCRPPVRKCSCARRWISRRCAGRRRRAATARTSSSWAGCSTRPGSRWARLSAGGRSSRSTRANTSARARPAFPTSSGWPCLRAATRCGSSRASAASSSREAPPCPSRSPISRTRSSR